MSHLRQFGRFCYDFVVGDDWTVAATVVVGLAVLALATHHGRNWFWLMPLAVIVMLGVSLRRLSRRM